MAGGCGGVAWWRGLGPLGVSLNNRAFFFWYSATSKPSLWNRVLLSTERLFSTIILALQLMRNPQKFNIMKKIKMVAFQLILTAIFLALPIKSQLSTIVRWCEVGGGPLYRGHFLIYCWFIFNAEFMSLSQMEKRIVHVQWHWVTRFRVCLVPIELEA